MSTDTRWWPNWNVTRLHLVTRPAKRFYGELWGQAVCGVGARPPEVLDRPWQAKRLAGGPQRCKHCLRAAAALASVASDHPQPDGDA